MKKFIIILTVLIVIILCVSCTSSKTNNSYDLNNLELGTKFSIYPSAMINYEYEYSFNKKTYIFNINNIEAVFYEKYTYLESDILSKPYYPFSIKVSVVGNTNAELSNNYFDIVICDEYGKLGSIECSIDSTGSFYGEKIFPIYTSTIPRLFFNQITSLRGVSIDDL